MIFSENLKKDWANRLTEKFNAPTEISSIQSVGGGDINQAFQLTINHGTVFVKMNDRHRFPEMLQKEARGLEFLTENSSFAIPKTIAHGFTDEIQWLILEHISLGSKKPDFWTEFGHRLANMHRSSSDNFGLDEDNYIGSLPQNNATRESWGDFFAEMRIEPLLKMAQDNGFASPEMKRLFKVLLNRADQLFPEESPAALHGDLWSGNFMCNASGEATIYDPAVYYGHREMDLGMTKLFGGFDSEFYRAYQEIYPLTSGWEDRIEIANLYPLLVHLNLFGTSYAGQIMNTLRRFA